VLIKKELTEISVPKQLMALSGTRAPSASIVGAFVGGSVANGQGQCSPTFENNYYNEDATYTNYYPGTVNYLGASGTTMSALGSVNHAVYEDWSFAGDDPTWIMGTLPQLRA
jgi:hypothetical protein